MFEFTWVRLGIFLAIFLGIPLFLYLFVRFFEWAETHVTPDMAFGCLIVLCIIILGIFAGYLAFFT